ncbi:hypothetical protein OAT15_03020 [Gammaproteobacteria bacterium]|nr:hypothetical protein [Gammaproteobacteria bacterium]
MNDDFKKYYENKEANDDSKSDARVITILITVLVVAATFWVANQ